MFVDPSGVPAGALAVLKDATERRGFAKVGRVMSVYGDVFIAEKRVPEGWDVLWVARDMARHLTCIAESSGRQRQQAAYEDALKNLRLRHGVFGH